MKRNTALLRIAIVLVVCVACGDSTSPTLTAVGTYALTLYRAQPLPALMVIGPAGETSGPTGEQEWALAGALTLQRNGFYLKTVRDSFYYPIGSQSIVGMLATGGRWSVSGTSLTLADTSVLYPGGTTQATLVNGVITDDVATEYRRQ